MRFTGKSNLNDFLKTEDQEKKSSTPKVYKLAIVTFHPVQYYAPLFQLLAQHPQIDLTVYYGSDSSLVGAFDAGFGKAITWDRPLLTGYNSVILTHYSENHSTLKRLRSFATIISELQKTHYDAVFLDSYTTPLSLFSYLGAWLSKTPIMLRNDSELFLARKWYLKFVKHVFLGLLFQGVSAFLIVGTANRDFYESFHIKPSKIFYAPHSVDNNFFSDQADSLKQSRLDLKQELGFAPGVPVIIFSGKFIERKRPLDLLQAYNSLILKGLEIGLIFIGAGALLAEMEAFIEKNKLKQVRISGFKNQSELAASYICGDIFVLPARYDTWGLVINEGMLFGMPVITTNMVASGLDLVKPGETGFIYKVGDIGQLTQYLQDLIENREKRIKMGESARQLVSTFNYDVCVDGILEALKKVVS